MSAFEMLKTAMTAPGQVTNEISEKWSIPSNQYQNTVTDHAYVPSSGPFQEIFQQVPQISNFTPPPKKSCASLSHYMQTNRYGTIFAKIHGKGAKKKKLVPSN